MYTNHLMKQSRDIFIEQVISKIDYQCKEKKRELRIEAGGWGWGSEGENDNPTNIASCARQRINEERMRSVLAVPATKADDSAPNNTPYVTSASVASLCSAVFLS
jgi:hypothetical protein